MKYITKTDDDCSHRYIKEKEKKLHNYKLTFKPSPVSPSPPKIIATTTTTKKKSYKPKTNTKLYIYFIFTRSYT